jgi:hypothetical protein
MNFGALLLLAIALLAAAPARADRVSAKLQVSAQVIITCRLDGSVARVGTPERATSVASFKATCSKGAKALVTSCDPACAAAPRLERARSEYEVAEANGEGTTVATVLF